MASTEASTCHSPTCLPLLPSLLPFLRLRRAVSTSSKSSVTGTGPSARLSSEEDTWKWTEPIKGWASRCLLLGVFLPPEEGVRSRPIGGHFREGFPPFGSSIGARGLGIGGWERGRIERKGNKVM